MTKPKKHLFNYKLLVLNFYIWFNIVIWRYKPKTIKKEVYISILNYHKCLRINPELRNHISYNPELRKPVKCQPYSLSSNQFLIGWSGFDQPPGQPPSQPSRHQVLLKKSKYPEKLNNYVKSTLHDYHSGKVSIIFAKQIETYKQNIYSSPNKIWQKIWSVQKRFKPFFKINTIRVIILGEFQTFLPNILKNTSKIHIYPLFGQNLTKNESV